MSVSPDATTSIDSLLRATARTPAVTTPQPPLRAGSVVADNFEIVVELGRGGMGVVYRALDRRLGREVAIKVMRADRWAHVPRHEIAALLEREARATARLKHPSIVTLYHAGEHEGAPYLVLELLHGESLAAQLRRPLALPTALALVRQVADALAHAHDEGVLHRDLKPHNVFVGDDGHVWVLDFGLASLQEAGGPDGGVAAMSQAGTPVYMAPEQRVGAAQDARTDVWALGLLLYQVVTAYEPPPLGAEADLTAPPWRTDLDRLPPSLAAVIRTAVSWRPDQRFPTVAGFLAALEAIPPGEVAPDAPVAPRRRRWPLALALVVAIAVVASVAVAVVGRASPVLPRRPVHFALPVLPTEPFSTFQSPMVTVSPDGRSIIYLGKPPSGTPGASQLYLRRLDEDQAVLLADTVDAEGPFFAPDGASIAYAKAGQLVRHPLDGGPRVALAPVHAGFRGGTWSRDGSIVYSPSWFSGLYVVAAAGGAPRPLTTLGPDEKSHRFPHVLPDGSAVLFVSSHAKSESFDDATIEAVSLRTGARRVITTGGAPRFVAPSTLLVPRTGTLVALPFDPRRLTVTGPPVTVLDELVTASTTGVAAFDAGAAGTLAYFVGGPALFTTQVARVARTGEVTPLAVPPRPITSVRVAADGKLLVRVDAANAALWLYDLARETHTRITWAWDADHAVIAADGDHLFLVVTRGTRAEIVRRRLDGTGEDELLWKGVNPANLDLSRDGSILLFDELDPTTGAADVMWLRADRPAAPTRFTPSPLHHETQPALSPDGAWLAYTSDVSGRDEIYVQAFPEPGPRVQVSAHGGRWARWSPDGRELIFRNGRQLLASTIEPGPRLAAARPELRFTLDDVDDPARRTFDVEPGGGVVTVMRAPTWRPADTLRIVLDWAPVPSASTGGRVP